MIIAGSSSLSSLSLLRCLCACHACSASVYMQGLHVLVEWTREQVTCIVAPKVLAVPYASHFDVLLCSHIISACENCCL